jgi:hypothetical protein
MMNVKSKTWGLSAAGLGALLLLAGPLARPAGAQVSIQLGRGDHRLEGQRFRSMRQLAHYLDEAAQKAAQVAGDTREERSGVMQRRFLWAINDFARQTRSFHERLDQYQSSPWDVADEVQALDQRARQVSGQIRGARAFPETYQDWAEAVNALNLMKRSLAGQDVAMPSPERRAYQPFDEHSRYSDGRHVEDLRAGGDRDGFVSGPPLREFRRLANSLTVEADRAVSAAERDPNRPDRGDRTLGDLRRFARRASDLNRSSAADALDPREIGPLVSDLMDDARQNGRAVNGGSSSPRAEWAPSIRLLEQMASIVQDQ